MDGVCKLCLEAKELQESHSIPRSFFNKAKGNGGQVISMQKGREPRRENLDPKEPMLCFECEQFLSGQYESYGIRLLRNPHNIRKNSDHIIISNFDYKRFYLFLLSILWRASNAMDLHYSSVVGNPDFGEMMRHCIKNNIVRFNNKSQVKIDNFIKIRVLRIVDSTGNIPDHVIKSVLTNFAFGEIESINGIGWYFIAECFIFHYVFYPGENYYDARTTRLNSQLTSGSHQKIQKVEVSKDRMLSEMFNYMIECSKGYHQQRQ